MARAERGFSLPELLVALSVGLLLAAAAMQAVLGETRLSHQLGARLRQRALAQRALALMRADGARATALSLGALGDGAGECEAAGRAGGRRVLLHLATEAGPVVYTLGSAPSDIWRGAVLMRCGPAFGLYGEPSEGAALNRVVLDGLELAGSGAEALSAGVVRVRLAAGGGAELLLAAPQP